MFIVLDRDLNPICRTVKLRTFDFLTKDFNTRVEHNKIFVEGASAQLISFDLKDCEFVTVLKPEIAVLEQFDVLPHNLYPDNEYNFDYRLYALSVLQGTGNLCAKNQKGEITNNCYQGFDLQADFDPRPPADKSRYLLSQDPILEVIDTQTAERTILNTLGLEGSQPPELKSHAFNPEIGLLAAVLTSENRSVLIIWNTRNGDQLLQTLLPYSTTRLAFSKDGQKLYIEAFGAVYEFELIE